MSSSCSDWPRRSRRPGPPSAPETRIKDAAFPVAKDLDTRDFAAMPRLSRPEIPGLAACEWIDQEFNRCFIGDTGTGKPRPA
jgi:DNA replication protein DnaC